MLLNTSSHDEDHYQDPFHALIRFAANSTIDGVPMIFPGQELGLSGAVVPPGTPRRGSRLLVTTAMRSNFGKPIPHFKKYNSLMPLWLRRPRPASRAFNFGLAQLAPVYAAIGRARAESPALRSSNRFFLNLKDGNAHPDIFSVAKFAQRNAAPNSSDVVFGFVNLTATPRRPRTGNNRFNVAIDADGDGANDFGIKPGRRYNVKNRAAYTALDASRSSTFLIPGDRVRQRPSRERSVCSDECGADYGCGLEHCAV